MVWELVKSKDIAEVLVDGKVRQTDPSEESIMNIVNGHHKAAILRCKEDTYVLDTDQDYSRLIVMIHHDDENYAVRKLGFGSYEDGKYMEIEFFYSNDKPDLFTVSDGKRSTVPKQWPTQKIQFIDKEYEELFMSLTDKVPEIEDSLVKCMEYLKEQEKPKKYSFREQLAALGQGLKIQIGLSLDQ